MQDCGFNAPYATVIELEQKHLECREEAIKLFMQTQNVSCDEFSQPFLEELKNQLEVFYRFCFFKYVIKERIIS